MPSVFIKPAVDYNLYIADFSEEKLDEIISALMQDTSINQYNIRPVYVDSVMHKGLFIVKFFYGGAEESME